MRLSVGMMAYPKTPSFVTREIVGVSRQVIEQAGEKELLPQAHTDWQNPWAYRVDRGADRLTI